MYLWAMSRAKGYAWIRRSKNLKGLIPHFGYAEEMLNHLIVIEYVPPENSRWTKDDMVIVFRGTYRVSILKKVSGRGFHTMKKATDWATTAVLASVRSSEDSAALESCSLCGRSCYEPQRTI